MKERYCFTYSERQSIAIQYRPLIPVFIISMVLLFSGILPPSLIFTLSKDRGVDYFPMVYILGTFSVLSFLPLVVFVTYFVLFRYNTSITNNHWYFNQIIEIDGNKLIVNQSNGIDNFYEELHINKIKKRKYATYYYESSHRYVAIPIEVIEEQEKR